MSDVVNLRIARKRKMRAAKEQAASESRALHGRSKAEKQRDSLLAEKSVRFVDGHQRDRTDRGEP